MHRLGHQKRWGTVDLNLSVADSRPQPDAIAQSPVAATSQWDTLLMDPTQRRIEARVISNAERNYFTIVLLGLGAVALLGGGAALTMAAPRYQTIVPVVMLVGLVALVVLALRRLYTKKVVIGVTTDGLTVDQRPGDVFSFRDTELGQWRALRTRHGELAGRALYLTCGPHRFVLGAADQRVASQLPTEGPQITYGQLDAQTSPQIFDELLTIIGPYRR